MMYKLHLSIYGLFGKERKEKRKKLKCIYACFYVETIMGYWTRLTQESIQVEE